MSKEIGDEDLDDYLDDVLHEFEEPAPELQTLENDEFMALLQENMSKLMGGDDVQGLDFPIQQPSQPKEFQDTISQTLNKLKNSSVQAEAKVQESKNELGFDEAAMEQMMKDLEGMMEGGDMEDIFGGVLSQLVNKELLYEPMKELADKYPDWINENESTLEKSEVTRFVEQHKIVVQIVAVFDGTAGEEPSAEESQKILELMQEVTKN
jgi:peroxin-19